MTDCTSSSAQSSQKRLWKVWKVDPIICEKLFCAVIPCSLLQGRQFRHETALYKVCGLSQEKLYVQRDSTVNLILVALWAPQEKSAIWFIHEKRQKYLYVPHLQNWQVTKQSRWTNSPKARVPLGCKLNSTFNYTVLRYSSYSLCCPVYIINHRIRSIVLDNVKVWYNALLKTMLVF